MIVLEHDAKELLAVQGFPVPGGIHMAQVPQYETENADEKAGPWIVKPQIPIGWSIDGDDVQYAHSPKEVAEMTADFLGSRIDGHTVHMVRIERAMDPASTASLSFELDPQAAGVRICVAAGDTIGKVQNLDGAQRACEVVVPDPSAVATGVARLTPQIPEDRRNPVTAAARQLAPLFFGYEALLIEIDPLLIFADGTWAAGDVKMILDENALFRHPELISLIERRNLAYRETVQKRAFGISHVPVDPDGEVGMITTGAGLAMQLIVELRDRGLAPYNFLDAGMDVLDDDPEPLTEAFRWLQGAPNLKAIMITAVAGATDLMKLASGMTSALASAPEMTVPVVACLRGSDADAAMASLEPIADRVSITGDIDAAIDLIGSLVKQTGPA